jgi:hypothetical protein
MWHEWERREKCIWFWWENRKDRDLSEDQEVDGRMDLRGFGRGCGLDSTGSG